MKNILLSFSVLVVISFMACKKSYSPSLDSGSYVMYVNACNGTGNIYITTKSNLAMSAPITDPGGIAYLDNSKYQTVPEGTDSIFVLLDPYDTLNFFTVSATENYYSLFISGSITKPAFFLFSDDLSVAKSGMATIRLVNLSSDPLPQTATIGNSIFASHIASNTPSSFVNIAPGSYSINVSDSENTSSAISLAPRQFVAGKIYTVLLTDTLSAGTPTPILTLITNNQ